MRAHLLIVVAVAILVAACGGGGDITVVVQPTPESTPAEPSEPAAGEPTTVAEPTPTPEADDDAGAAPDGTPTPLPAPTTEPTATPEPAPVEPAETVVVEYQSNSFGFAQNMVATVARDGSYRIDYDDGSIEVRDAEADTQTSYFVFDDDVSVVLTEGLGLGGPDLFYGFFLPGFSTIDHVLALAGSAFAGQGVVLGRDAVLYEADVVPNAIGGGPDRIVMAIDAETGLVLEYLATFEGEEQSSLVATSFEAFGDRLDVFVLPADLPAPNFTYDQGFQRTTLDQVEGLVGYTPIVPNTVPEGYAVDAVAVAPGQSENFTGAEGSNPPSVDVVHIRYRNGWRTFTTTTRRVGDQPQFWIDPFSGEGQFYELLDAEVTGAYFTGQIAELSTAPETVPHLWVRGGDLVFTVTGPLRDFELGDIVNSLEPA
ncbi:MAG: hypothetical protein AAF480_04150 [Actinomycetota bacterium]